jgi:hypothetical protein
MKNKLIYSLFVACILFEPFMLTHSKSLHLDPIIWLITAILPACILFNQRGFLPSPVKLTLASQATVAWVICGFGSLFSAIALSKIFAEIAISPSNSDILPSITFYVQRLIAGTDPYAPMQFPGWTVIPNYLPLRWLPFIPAEILHFDYRWVGFLALTAVLMGYTHRLTLQGLSLRQISLHASAPWFMLFVFIYYDRLAFGNAVETLIAAYYLALAFSLFTRPIWIALGISLCLLSRFSFTFWLPAYSIMLFMHYGFKPSLRIASYVLIAFLSLYFLPFALKDMGATFLEGLKYYDICALAEWSRQGWQEPGSIPIHLSKGLGFAYYFYRGEGTEVIQYAACKQFHQLICLATAALLTFGFYYFRTRGLNFKIYGIVSLKIYLTIFYGFFPMPYHYLFLTSCMLSVALLYHYRPLRAAEVASVG